MHKISDMQKRNVNKEQNQIALPLSTGDVDSLLGNWLVGCSANFLGEWWSREAAFLQAHCWHMGTDLIHTCTCILLFNFFEPILSLTQELENSMGNERQLHIEQILPNCQYFSISSYLSYINLSQQLIQTVHSCSSKLEIYYNLNIETRELPFQFYFSLIEVGKSAAAALTVYFFYISPLLKFDSKICNQYKRFFQSFCKTSNTVHDPVCFLLAHHTSLGFVFHISSFKC